MGQRNNVWAKNLPRNAWAKYWMGMRGLKCTAPCQRGALCLCYKMGLESGLETALGPLLFVLWCPHNQLTTCTNSSNIESEHYHDYDYYYDSYISFKTTVRK